MPLLCSTDSIACKIWREDGDANIVPATEAVKRPSPTYAPNAGSCPEPPPEIMLTREALPAGDDLSRTTFSFSSKTTDAPSTGSVSLQRRRTASHGSRLHRAYQTGTPGNYSGGPDTAPGAYK